MATQMQQSACALVMEYVPGTALFHVRQPFRLERLEQTAADLGRYGKTELGGCRGNQQMQSLLDSSAGSLLDDE